jgi:hypothetical protein
MLLATSAQANLLPSFDRCSPGINFRSFGDISPMVVTPTGAATLPCQALLRPAHVMRGVTNYGGAETDPTRAGASIQEASVLSIYANEARRIEPANTTTLRTTFFSLDLANNEQIVIALEKIQATLYVSAYHLQENGVEVPLGRVQRDKYTYGVHISMKYGVVDSITIAQDSGQSRWPVELIGTQRGLRAWTYGMLLGGFNGEAPTDNLMPVQLYLNTGLRPWLD